MTMTTDLKTRQTFILETRRAGSRKLYAYSMPAIGREGDKRVPLRTVPLYIRRAAKVALGA